MTPHASPSHRLDTRKVSEVLAALATGPAGSERVRLADLVAALEDRAFGLLLLIFSLPNAIGLGTIPGVSTIFGLPQIFLAVQMALGLERPWLPRVLLEKGIARADFLAMVEKSTPYLLRVEKVLRPRWLVMSSYAAERALGLVFVVLAGVVSLPILFGNQPPAVAMVLISLGVIERDGVFVVIGLVAAVVAVAIVGAVIAGGLAVVLLLLKQTVGG